MEGGDNRRERRGSEVKDSSGSSREGRRKRRNWEKRTKENHKSGEEVRQE